MNKISKDDYRYKVLSRIPKIKNEFVKFRKKRNSDYSYDLQLVINEDNMEYKYIFFKSCIKYDGNNRKYIDMEIIGKYIL